MTDGRKAPKDASNLGAVIQAYMRAHGLATHGETAVKLARLYELARYAPLDEPPTRAEIVEARRLVCDLAGVDEG